MTKILDRCFILPSYNMRELFDKAYQLTREHFKRAIHFYFPNLVRYDSEFYQCSNTRFPSISVTGDQCALNCEHCKGILLQSMIPALTPQQLLETCTQIKENGGIGCLISGGSLGDGGVPLMDYVSTIKKVKHDLGLQIVVHTGLINPPLAKALADTEIDAAMIDIIGSDETLRNVYHLKSSINAFDQSLAILERNHIPTVPHILVGIHYGKLKGERKAIEVVTKHTSAAIVVVALMPLNHTPMETYTPPQPLDIARVMIALRLLQPSTPLLLGCARPKGFHKVKTDILAIKAGINGIAYPSDEAFKYAETLKLEHVYHEKCCSLLWQDLQIPR